MTDKKYIISVSCRGKTKDLGPMTLKEFEDYFKYTLEKGRSWQNEKGNKKIPVKFTNINKFVDALNQSESNAAFNGMASTYYSISKEVNESMLKINEETGDYSYYEVVYGYQMAIVRTDWPITDYGAITDILIDNLEKEGVGEPYLISIDQAENEYNEDEYVIGGNHGLALVHNGNFNIKPIPEQDAKRYEKNDHISIYTESKNINILSKEGIEMSQDVTNIVNDILEGKDITAAIMEGAGRLASVKVVDEPYGKGVEVRDTNGAVYRYAVDVHDPKYYTPEKVKNAVLGLAKKYNYDMGRIYNFLKNNTLGNYDKDVSSRAGLGQAEIVAEPNGEGLKITFDNGKVFRYTVDINDEKYDTLDKLKDGAEGMWRHGASVDGIISFLDNHAILYAREGKERLTRKQLAGCVLESKSFKLDWVKE